ncbi:hypothetical protein HY214_03750 [Candidatus Roizmanbacteria bacterium]|nr:hypothetical protein [Candidatus Roizmanbacteria bacterium]
MLIKYSKLLKIGLVIGLALLIVVNYSGEVFVAGTPQMRNDVGARIAGLPRALRVDFNTLLAKVMPSKDQPLIRIGEATYAKTTAEGSTTYLDLKNMTVEITWVKTKTGKRMPVMTPKGQKPRPDLIEYIINNY